MARQFSLPAQMKIVELFSPQTTNAALSSQVITLKNCAKAWLILDFNQAVGFASVPTLNQATNIAAATNKAGPLVPIWANEDCAATDTLVRQAADAAAYTLGNNIKRKQVVFEVDPSRLDVTNGYCCVYITIGTSSQATNFVSTIAILQGSLEQSPLPSAILN